LDVVVGKIGLHRRHVRRCDKVDPIALQAVQVRRAACGEEFCQVSILRLAHVFAGRPKKAAASAAVDLSIGAVGVADRDAAVGIGHRGRKADGILVGNSLPSGGRSGRRGHGRIAQHAADALRCQCFEIEGAGRRRPLGEHHAALLIECDLGNLSRACTQRHGGLKRCVVAERAIGL
jgi:hypothetical protein